MEVADIARKAAIRHWNKVRSREVTMAVLLRGPIRRSARKIALSRSLACLASPISREIRNQRERRDPRIDWYEGSMHFPKLIGAGVGCVDVGLWACRSH